MPRILILNNWGHPQSRRLSPHARRSKKNTIIEEILKDTLITPAAPVYRRIAKKLHGLTLDELREFSMLILRRIEEAQENRHRGENGDWF